MKLTASFAKYKQMIKSLNIFSKSLFEKRFEQWLNTDFIVTFSGTKVKRGKKSSCMKFEEASTAKKRRKWMSIEKNFRATEMQDAFLRNSRVSGSKGIANAIVILLNFKDTEVLNISSQSECVSFVPYSSEQASALYSSNIILYTCRPRKERLTFIHAIRMY